MKRFLITLGLSVGVWYVTVIVQGITGFNAPLNLPFSGPSCQVSGFPIAICKLPGTKESIWIFNLINIFFWFWIIHLFGKWFDKRKSSLQ